MVGIAHGLLPDTQRALFDGGHCAWAAAGHAAGVLAPGPGAGK